MTTTTMHFGPEWMRTKPQPASRTQAPPSPPPASASASAASTYSSLLSSAAAPPVESKDQTHPFRYSKEEMLRIYREGGGKGGLGLEVERWDGVVRESGIDPIGLKEMGEAEKKLFATPLNSDLRRRQSTDFLHLNTQNLERPRLNHANSASAAGSPLRERFGSLMTRRRDSTGQSFFLSLINRPSMPRKLSLTGQAPLMSPREAALPSPRGRLGHTPSFDGVLNGGESWIARRRASEGLTSKPAPGSARDPGEDPKELKIKEEDEENNPDRQDPQKDAQSTLSSVTMQRPDNIEPGAAQLPLDVPGAQSLADSPASTSASIGPPPCVEWSYLDPQGQVQGPFKADIMQKWSDEGYFTDNLLMKRTTFDTEWTPVGELKRRAGNNSKVFLTPIPAHAPPGLIRRTDSPFSYSNPNEAAVYHNGPFQPSPIRTLRSSTLDSFNSNYSDSPASSFGAPGGYNNSSPDPAAFGGRAAQFAMGGDMGNRLGGYPLNTGEASPALSGRSGFGVPPNDYRSPGFGNIAPGRGSSLDVNGGFGSPAGSWSTPAYDSGYGVGNSSHFVATPGTNGFQGSFGTPSHPSLGGMGFVEQQFPPSPSAHYTTQQTIPDIFDQQQQQAPMRASQPPIDPNTTAPPWGAFDPPITKRTVPFDATPSKTSAVNNQSPWGTGRGSQSSSQVNDVSPWLAASQGITDDWKDEQQATSSLTVSNLGQHDQEETQLEEEAAVDVVAEITPESIPEVPVAASAPAPSKSRAKSTLQQTIPQQQSTSAKAIVPDPAPMTIELPEPNPTATAVVTPKAWAKEDEPKKSTTTSLRKIQDAEAKKAEAKKAAEREKERATRAAQPSAVPVEDAQPFTASWGLPTSKAGKSSVPAATPKEVSAPTPPVTTPPVWTNAAKPKKSMKEIQEEEERRKKAVVKETAANVASRRGYAESTSKAPAAPTVGSAWTTVGPSGKQTSATTPPARPPVAPTPIASSSTATARVNGTAARPAAPASKAPTNNAKVDEFPIAPSGDFLKWLAESLKGLNSSVNVEDIITMLLSFPVDPDPSTAEIVSDLIYANSTTLDGRRFAADFMSRRKADAVARAKAGPGAATGKSVSIADVVKAQPKPQAQSEWGGFKVVNKKKKGGRS
ncbi:hypothetical protein BT96DRAFT_962438 [Gymnopus androsaceus JB14]|uniref:GYF domain-containing protein n=1 Tax=Gymnopus androsaceus JB14 TaxID=1447944 RepID=A0A6A4IK38_9AGAR|nr:hypothetical protein BT96DRAFT_962438 [Gymnopus androsaceus JB14]